MSFEYRLPCGPLKSSDWVPLLIAWTYMFPLFVGYIVVLRPVRERCRGSSFFKLYYGQTIVMLSLIFYEMTTRVFRSGVICDVMMDLFWKPSYFLGAFIYFPILYLPIVTSSFGLLICVNQTSAVWRPFQYEKMWNSLLTPLILLVIIGGAILGGNILLSPAYLLPMTNSTAELRITYVPLFSFQTSLWTSVYYFILSGVIVIATIMTSVGLAKTGLVNVRKYEKRTMAFGFANSLAILSAASGNVIMTFFIYIFPKSSLATVALNIREPTVFVQMAVPLIAMVTICSDVRKSITGRRKDSDSQTTIRSNGA